ncbi:hypothetical protein MSAN_01208500 [Mycena sanguinolenta]|uniref:Uncharacterized protein n=1 Tax=Mycena sanguinolenta TaxID=230812 RepID=A0A8H6YCS3_9AGAR|nr:hypothetical protein MSAN_01208500 [Mycena sanguinolenta]
MASILLSARSRELSKVDASILSKYGRDTLQDVVGFTVETALCSVYGVFFALAVYAILRRGLKSRGSIVMLLVVVYLYGTSVTQWAVDFWATLQHIHSLFMTTDVPIPDRVVARDAADDKVAALQEAIFDINLIVADAVQLWFPVYFCSPHLVCPPFQLVNYVALMTWACSQFFTVIDITCNIDLGPFPGADRICPSSSRIVWGFSLGTNVVCTLLIGFKAWQHCKMLKQLGIGGKTHGMSTQNILSLLVESGFIYIFLLAIQIICYDESITPASPWYYFQYILVLMGQQVTGMYPTLIIAIVNFKRTIWEEHPIIMDNCTVLNSLPWKVNPGRSGATRTFDSCSVIDICPEKVHDEQCTTDEI